MAEMSYDDLCRDLRNCVVMYKNRPVYVESITRNCDVMVVNLLSQKTEVVPFKLKDFNKPIRRVGFVNTLGSVVYIERVPKRKYYMGLSLHNVLIRTLYVNYPSGAGYTKDRMKSLSLTELGEAVMCQYPSFCEAFEQAKQVEGAYAFDKQFAVTYSGLVFYKQHEVGLVAPNATSIEDIQWHDGREFLKVLLEKKYEKVV